MHLNTAFRVLPSFWKNVTHFEAFDLIRSQSSVFCDFIKINITVGIRHFEVDDTLEDETVETVELPARLTKILITQARCAGPRFLATVLYYSLSLQC